MIVHLRTDPLFWIVASTAALFGYTARFASSTPMSLFTTNGEFAGCGELTSAARRNPSNGADACRLMAFQVTVMADEA